MDWLEFLLRCIEESYDESAHQPFSGLTSYYWSGVYFEFLAETEWLSEFRN